MKKWGGRRARAWSTAVLASKGTVCALRSKGCTYVATEADHILPRSTHPHLQYDPTNGLPACRHCNAARGKTPHPSTLTTDTRDWFTC